MFLQRSNNFEVGYSFSKYFRGHNLLQGRARSPLGLSLKSGLNRAIAVQLLVLFRAGSGNLLPFSLGACSLTDINEISTQ